MNINYVHSLAFNLSTEVEKATKLLYELNDKKDFTHIIVDLGFPLETGDVIPEDLDVAKARNSDRLKHIAFKYGSQYVSKKNEGVSQNWTSVYKYLNMDDSDILAGADPDEHPIHKNWVRAMGNVIRSTDRIALASLIMDTQVPLMKNFQIRKKVINGENVYWLEGLINWALIGLSGEFLNLIGAIPYPAIAPKYGWIETELYPLIVKNNYKWIFLPDYQVHHTDFELGDPGTSSLLREWKNQIVYKVKETGQPDFCDWLNAKKVENSIK
ncbi:MAG: hypothetical protein PHT07_15275 [Paludibacter sp.]|nr:hypothetical protein [Paludibacter sp.]